MNQLVALCADKASVNHPALLGLDGEMLTAQPWLKLFSSGEEMRRYLAQDMAVGEVWVASCDDVEPINVAASVKADRRGRRVHLVSSSTASGSLATRMNQAGLDPALSPRELTVRYAQRKAHANGEAFAGWENAATAPLPVVSAKPHTGTSVQARVETVVQPCSNVPVQARTETMAPPRTEASARMPQCAAPTHTAQKTRAFFLPVVSGSGGAGKSTVSALAAFLCQHMGYKTLLADFDLQFGDAARLAGKPDALALDDLVRDPSKIESLKPSDTEPAVLAAPRRLEDSESLIASIPALLAALSERFEVIVANTGAFWAEQHAMLLEASSRTLFLIDQRPSSLQACRHALDLCVRCGIATGPFVFAVNRFAKNALFTSIDVSCALNGSYTLELVDGGRDVEELMGAGYIADLVRERNALCASIHKMLLDILPQRAGREWSPQAPQRKHFMRRKSTRKRERRTR